MTHCEVLHYINLNVSTNVGMQGELTHFLCRVISRCLWSNHRFHVAHADFEPVLPRTKMVPGK